jgi:hypothetical protein
MSYLANDIDILVIELPHVHRLFSGVHLPAVGNGLFWVATAPIITVIYIIITKPMETRHTPNTASVPSKTRARAHAFLAVLGIMAAVVCALVLLQDAPALHLETTRLGIGGISKLTAMMQVASSWQF